MKKIKVNKKFLSLLIAGSMTLSFAGCTGDYTKKDDIQSTIVSSVETKNEKKQELSSYYELYNINENPKIDEEIGVVYYQLKDWSPNFFNTFVLEELTVDQINYVLEKMNEDLDYVKENIQGENFKTEILSNNDSAFLAKFSGNSNFDLLAYTNDMEGYLMYFKDNLKLRSYEDLNCVVFYDNDNKRICIFDKIKGCLSVITNAAYIGCKDGVVSFARSEDPNNIYFYNVNNYEETKQAVTNLKVLDKYVTYTTTEKENEEKKEVFKIIDVLTSKEQTFKNKENFWVTLSDKSILYVNNNFEYKRYQNCYNLLDGSFESEYCILNNLTTYPDENENHKYYRNSIYINRDLDIFCEVPHFDFMEEHDTKKGYFKYVSNGKSTYLVDLTTCDRYFEKGIVDSKDYTIIKVYGNSNDKENCTLFKDKNGKTVASIKSDCIGTDYIQKYFDDTKTAIQCSLYNGNVYYSASLLDLSDLDKPKKIISSDYNTSYNIILTPIDNTLILYNNRTKKYKLINHSGEALLDGEYDFMNIKSYGSSSDNKETVYVLKTGKDPYSDITNSCIVYDKKGNIIMQDEYKTIYHKYIDSEGYIYNTNINK